MTVSRRPGTTGIGGVADEDVDAYIEFDDDDDYDDDDPFADDDDYFDDRHGYRALRPEWMHPKCADPCAALELGTCCMYPAGLLVRRALDLAEAVDRALNAFEGADAECALTARELAVLFDSVPGLVAEIRSVLPGMDKTAAAQLLCPIGRLNLVTLELAGRSGCPWACDNHGAPDRRPVLAPLVSLLEDCDEALWAAILPRPRRRR